MVIVYESKTGFTKRYADMLVAKTNLKVFQVQVCKISGKRVKLILKTLFKPILSVDIVINNTNKIDTLDIKCSSGRIIDAYNMFR